MELTQVLSKLEAAGINLTGREISEALWLAQFLPQSSVLDSPNEIKIKNNTNEPPTSNFTEELKTVLETVPKPETVSKRDSGTDLYSNNKTNIQDDTSTVSDIVPAKLVQNYSGRALPNERAIASALRPLMRRIPSKIDYELDEKATAQQIAEKYLLGLRVWTPILKPAATRWLEIALVVDNSTSMVVWQAVAQELYSLLIRQGAFRDVRMWRLDTESELAPQLFYANNNIELAPARSYKELFDPSGKRLILVLSDCVAKAWQDGRIFSLLANLAQRANTTILQVWPERLWKRTILGYTDTLVSARSPGLPNTQLTVEQQLAFGLSLDFLDEVTNEQVSQKPKRVPIPIVALEPHALSNWARMVGGIGHVWVPAIQIEINSHIKDNKKLENQSLDNQHSDNENLLNYTESDPHYLVENFQATALPVTQKLAGLLASVPLQLPIIRLVQNSLLPSSEILHLSEFLTSGLVYRVQNNIDNPTFEFVQGVRDLLRGTVSISESIKVLQQVGQYINKHFGEGESFAAFIPNVNGVESLVFKEQTLPFAQLQAEVLESLGGVHRFTAQHLREKIAQYEEVASSQEKSLEEKMQSLKASPSRLKKMLRSLKASPSGLKKIKEARKRKGLAIDNPELLEKVSKILEPKQNWEYPVVAVSIGTWKRFLRGEPVKLSYFIAFCQVLELNWEELVDTLDEVKGTVPLNKSSRVTHDWDAVPDVSIFYDRSIELSQLKQWLIKDKCRLLTILAMGGMGKTALAVKLAQEVSEEFDYIIWRSLQEAPTVEKIIIDVLWFLSQQQEIDLPQSLGEKITRLIHYLQTSRCLLILDNGESILQGGSSTGCYREGYEGYGELFRRVGESQHQSCLILTSREQFQEVRQLAGENLPVRVWELQGLKSAAEILTTRGISGSPSDIEDLIKLYHGNPLALQIVPATIKKLFNGNIKAFLNSGTIIFDDINDLLTQQFQRLSKPEQSLMYWLAINRQPMSERDLVEDVLGLSQRQIRSSLNSLLGRCLIESTHEGSTLQGVVMEYVSEVFIDKVINELESCDLELLRTHAIIKAYAPDYIRKNQTQVLLKPIVEFLCKNYTKKKLEYKFRHIVDKLREEELQVTVGYAGGNLINLLTQLQVNLSGYDFSCLPISQAYLQGVELLKVNFSDCSFNKTVFSQSLGSIFSVIFSPDQKLLATGGMDGYIRFWNITNGTQMLAWQAHDDWIRCVDFSSDGKLIASCGNDSTVKIWDSESSKCLKIFQGHTDWVRSVYFVQGKRFVISASSDRTAKIWSVDLGVCVYTFHEPDTEVWSVAFSNDGRTLATGSASSIKLWNIWTNKCLRTFDESSACVRSLAFSPNGKFIASSSDDFNIRLWDAKTQQCLKLFEGHTGEIRTLTFIASSNTKEMLVSASDDHTIRLWDTQTGCSQILTGHTDRIWSICYCRQLNVLFSCGEDETIKLWDIRTLQCIKTLGIPKPYEGMNINPKPYEGMNINGVSGLNSATLESLRVLGAVSI